MSLWRKAPFARQGVEFAPEGGGGSSVVIDPIEGAWVANTVDTGQPYKGIMLADGTVRAIPFDITPPVAPTGLALTPRMTSVSLTWNPAPGAAVYKVARNGVDIGTTSLPDFKDTTVTIGNTYAYRVSTVDSYQQRSPPTDPVSAVIDISLNHAPADVVITVWPTPIPTDGPAFVRVNAMEIDVQTMTTVLNVDAGALTATNDPSVWILRI